VAKILLAEDDPSQRSMVRTILEMRDHTVTEAATGGEALQRLRTDTFDVVLLDVMMPELSGYQVLEKLAEIDGFETPIIMVTAQNDAPGIAREARTGAIEHVSKPYRVEELEDTVARVLALTPEERTRRAAALRARAETFETILHLRETLEPPEEPKRRRS
jgi:CheY-like chemotaxis protein